jgi:hypothetical protein
MWSPTYNWIDWMQTLSVYFRLSYKAIISFDIDFPNKLIFYILISFIELEASDEVFHFEGEPKIWKFLMTNENKKSRTRSNTDLLRIGRHSCHSVLLDTEFESTKLKLDLLRKFERTMLSQRES